VRAEADQPDGGHRQQAEHGGAGGPRALAPARRREHEEGQREAGGDLDADADGQRAGAGAKARAGARRKRQRGGERHHDQRVVVRAADGEHEQHGVQADERRGPARRLAELGRRARDQRDGGEAAGDGQGLERPQPAGEPERRRGVAGQREQRPVGGVLVGPADEPEDFVARRLRGDVRVRVQAVQRPQAGEAEVAEDVLGDQRRAQQQDRVRGHDRRDDRPHRQRARERQHEQVARAHDQRQRLKAAGADAHVQALQRAGQPGGPAAAACGHVARGFAGGAGGRQQDSHGDAQQAEHAERARQRSGTRRRAATGGARAGLRAASGLGRRAGQGRGGRHRLIVTSSTRAGV
jgi:hypothetical protein